MGIWSFFFQGEDKLKQNVQDASAYVVQNKPTTHEDETLSQTYEQITEELRKTAITNESIGMAVNAYEKGVFGAGLSIQNASDNDTVNESIEDILKTFCKRKNFEFQGRFHFNFWARFMSKDIIREGGVLIRLHKATPTQAKKRKWKLPYKIEMLEISSIDFHKNDKIKKIYNGVQVDRYNRPQRLWFKGGKSVAFTELLMYSAVTRITQYNGVSPIYPSLPSIKRQEDHATSETTNAAEQAKVSDVYKTKIADTLKVKATGDFEQDILASTTREQRKIDPSLPEKDAKLIDVDEEYTRLDRGAYSSAFEVLNKFANTRIAASIGITLDEYTQDLSDLTFHGGQVAQIKNDETYSIIRDDLVELVIDEFFTDMLKWCYITGYTDIKPENIKLSYIKRPRKSAQPAKDAVAYDKNYKNGFQTQGDIVKEISGENYSDYLKRREREELKRIESAGRILAAKKKAGLVVEEIEPKETDEN